MAQGPKGNEDALYADRVTRMGRRLHQADGAVYRSRDRPETVIVALREVRVKVPEDALGEFMVVMKGEADGQKFVAFYKAEDYAGAVTGAVLAWENGSLKWREDRPWSGGG